MAVQQLNATSEEVAALRELVSQNNLGSFVTITATSYADAFVCPSDGYVFTYNASNAQSYVQISGANADQGPAIGSVNTRDTAFVKKGMKLYIVGTLQVARFFPFA